MTLTPKQDAFAMAFVETGNASEAYRRAYNVGQTTKPETVNRKAKELLDNGKISARVDELKAQHGERHNITVDDLIAELDEARDIALSALKPQSAAAVSATLGKAKLLGMLVDKLDARIAAIPLPASIDDLA